jgi:hypothetical protein
MTTVSQTDERVDFSIKLPRPALFRRPVFAGRRTPALEALVQCCVPKVPTSDFRASASSSRRKLVALGANLERLRRPGDAARFVEDRGRHAATATF